MENFNITQGKWRVIGLNFSLLFLLLFLLIAVFGCDFDSMEHDEPILDLEEPNVINLLTYEMSNEDIVLLGEATHGTQEFYEIRSIISKKLINDHDFDFIAVEGDWNSIYELNLYVKGLSNRTSAKEIMDDFDRWPRWMWANEEIMGLIEWLREYNKELSTENKIGFYGMDVYGVEKSLIAVEEMIGDKYKCLSRFDEDFSLYANYLSFGNEPCYGEARDVYEMIREEPRFKEEFNEKDYFYLRQNVLVVKNAEIHFRGMVDQRISSWNERVLHMNETVSRLMDYYGGKGIVWAHNTHVGDARATEMVEEERVNIGQLLREAEKNIFILGFGTFKGEVLAGRGWGEAKEIMKVPKANDNSYEALFEEMGLENSLINLRSSQIPEKIKEVNNNRAIGVVYNPEIEYPGNYVRTNLKERYDSFIFIRETNYLRLIE